MSKIKNSFSGKIPKDVNVSKNIAEARNYAKTHYPWETLVWFKNKIGNKKDWDYKQQGREYENFGNWHYGVVAQKGGHALILALKMILNENTNQIYLAIFSYSNPAKSPF